VVGSIVLALATATVAGAQAPAYPAKPPTAGALYSDGQTGRYLLDGTWLYRADLGDVGVAQGWWRNVAATAGWAPVSVPNAYNAGNLSNLSQNGYVGWYRKDFTLPTGAFARYVPNASRHWILRFESVNYRATVWLNGRELGTHVGAYLPFEFDLGNLRSGVNRLIVRVDDRRGPSDLPPGPGGSWWNYGGLLREVYLRAVQVADLSQVQVRTLLPCPSGLPPARHPASPGGAAPESSGCSATISEQALVRNVTSSPQRVQLRGRYGSVPLEFGAATIPAGGTWTAKAAIVFRHPHLWAPGSPTLYRATLTLSDDRGRTLQGYVTYSGIRSIKLTSGGRLELNGRLLDLRGVDLHEQDISSGAAMSPAQIARLIGWIKQLGATVVRAHYPLGPVFEEMADRAGILIWSEVPVYQVQSQYLAEGPVLAQAESMLQQNILDNENHPSVLLWSIGNELGTPVDAPEATYISQAAALAHRLDPTRPVGLAVTDWPGVPCQAAYGPLDVIGYNDYFGWFDAGGGSTDDRDALSPFLNSVRACYPTKALFVTEFGFDGSRNGPVEERGTYQFQANAAAFHLSVFAAKPWLSGAFYYVLQNYYAFPGYSGGDPWPDPPLNQKGLIDQSGNHKLAFAVVQAIYKATVQIAPAPGALL